MQRNTFLSRWFSNIVSEHLSSLSVGGLVMQDRSVAAIESPKSSSIILAHQPEAHGTASMEGFRFIWPSNVVEFNVNGSRQSPKAPRDLQVKHLLNLASIRWLNNRMMIDCVMRIWSTFVGRKDLRLMLI